MILEGYYFRYDDAEREHVVHVAAHATLDDRVNRPGRAEPRTLRLPRSAMPSSPGGGADSLRFGDRIEVELRRAP